MAATVSLKLSETLNERIRAAAAQHRQTLADTLRDAVEMYLDQRRRTDELARVLDEIRGLRADIAAAMSDGDEDIGGAG